MSLIRSRPRLHIQCNGPRKKENFIDNNQPNLGNLSPDLQPNTPPEFPQKTGGQSTKQNVYKIGRYLLLNQLEGEIYKSVNCQTKEECICKVSIL